MMGSGIQIALAQMDVRLGDPQSNFERVLEVVAEAAGRSCDLVLLPELWSTGYDLSRWESHADTFGEGMFARLSELALEYKTAIGGSILERRNGRAYNTFVLFGPDGASWGIYRKIHLFRLMDEHLWLAPGEEFGLATTPWGPVGLAVCYDLRFPEMFRHYAVAGAGLVLLVAEWPAERIHHWRTLVQARAIENQLFVAAVNRVGRSAAELFGGQSLIVDPWGNIRAEGDAAEQTISTQIDLSEVTEVRSRIPVLDDRRPEIYSR